ncbi:hypothetical protein P7C70_g1341, partial [Phenoliferia sp. Uapishka_3]
MRITKSGVSEYVALAPNVILPSTEPPLDVPPPNEHALLEIPIDIVRLILECVVESDGIVSAGKKGGRSQRVLNGSAPVLAACCLLSRSFYLIAREMLYASIVVPGPLVQEDVVSQLWLDDAGAVTPRKLVESLADNPHLAHLVRHITIEFKQEQLSPPRLASQLITRLLDLCSGADSFRLSSPGDAWAACASALTSRRSRLRRLELRGVTEAPENGRITRILQLSPGLQVLTLENISWMALPSATNNPPSLSHLTIALHLTEPHTLPSILQNSKDSLRSLDLHVSSHHFLSILTTFTSLRHLTLTIFDLALDHRIRPQDTDSTLVDSIISTFPQLTIKKLSLVVGPSSRSGDTVAVLSSLPPTLQSLHITHVEPHILLDFLGSDRSPNLRDIELRRGQGPILTYQAWVSSCLTEPGFLEACAGRGMVVHGGDHSASPVFSVERAAFETLEQYLQPALDLRQPPKFAPTRDDARVSAARKPVEEALAFLMFAISMLVILVLGLSIAYHHEAGKVDHLTNQVWGFESGEIYQAQQATIVTLNVQLDSTLEQLERTATLLGEADVKLKECRTGLESDIVEIAKRLGTGGDSGVCSDSVSSWSFGYTSTATLHPSLRINTHRIPFDSHSGHVWVTRDTLLPKSNSSPHIVGYKIRATRRGGNGWWKRGEMEEFGGSTISFQAIGTPFLTAQYEAEIFFVEGEAC